MRYFVSRNVLCPYYRREQSCKLHCEGVKQDTALEVSFSTQKSYKDYRLQFCCKAWESCRVAQMLNQKYEEEAQRLYKEKAALRPSCVRAG